MSLEHLVLRQWETAISWPPKGVIGDLYLVTKLHLNHAALPPTIPIPEAEVAMSLEHLVLRQWKTAISWPPKGVIGDPYLVTNLQPDHAVIPLVLSQC